MNLHWEHVGWPPGGVQGGRADRVAVGSGTGRLPVTLSYSPRRMDDLGRRVIDLVRQHPQVRGIRLVGSRATQRARAESDWDFRVETFDFSAVAAALPDLLRPLDPLAKQWDRLSDRRCWIVIVPGPAKIDLIFPQELHVQEPPWDPQSDNLAAIDAHFWDWTLWLRGKAAGCYCELIAAELEKLSEHLLRPLGVERIPATIAEAVALYQRARDDAERHLGCAIPRALASEVAAALIPEETK
jgi:predicted nucleotidyltransferase